MVIIGATYSSHSIASSPKQREALMPLRRKVCYPTSGIIQRNQPWFYWTPQMDKKGETPELKARYAFRLSQDSTFTTKDGATIILNRMFYSPHRILEKGRWFWQYGWVNTKGDILWKEKYSFKVSGDEISFVSPSFDQMSESIPTGHPRVLCFPNEIGKIAIPEKEIQSFIEGVNLSAKLKKSLIYNNKKVLDSKKNTLSPKQYRRFVGKRTKEIYKKSLDRFDRISKAYLLTGEKKYLEASLDYYHYLKKQYKAIVKSGFINDFTRGFYLTASATIYDVAYDRLSKEERSEIEEMLVKEQKETFVHLQRTGHYNNLDSHLWQHHMRTFFTTALTLYHHVPEAKKWVEYVYELWTMRAPVGSLSDGGWAPGNGYFDANKTSLIAMSVYFTRLTGVDYLSQPWFQNTGKYFYYTSPVGFLSGGFGDNADVKRENNASFLAAMAKTINDPYARLYLNQQKALTKEEKENKVKNRIRRKKFNLKNQTELYWLCALYKVPHKKVSLKRIKPERASMFSDIGVASMRSNPTSKNSTLLTFRSSPFGATGHAHACQNAFNLQVNGEPLFFRTGYYSSFVDPHSLMSYRHAQAHNTILMDTKGQPMTPSSYGMITRFGTSESISYAKGDASHAYNGNPFRDYFLDKMKEYKLDPKDVLGRSDAKMSKFDRHIALLGDKVVMIYDDIEADIPVAWKWLLQSREEMKQNGASIMVNNGVASGCAYIFSSEKLKVEVTNRFASPAVDWLGNGAKRGIKYVPHWHASATSEKSPKIRFFSLISLADGGKPSVLKINKSGEYLLKGWHIKVSLSDDEKPSFVAKHAKKGALVFGKTKVEYKGVTYSLEASSTYIVDPKSEQTVIRMADVYPDICKYY